MRSMPSTNPSRVVEALASVSLIRTTLPLVRSTSVPTDERLAAPLIKSPSQWPGTSRPSISPGRLWMLAMLQLAARGVEEGAADLLPAGQAAPGEIEGRLV